MTDGPRSFMWERPKSLFFFSRLFDQGKDPVDFDEEGLVRLPRAGGERPDVSAGHALPSVSSPTVNRRTVLLDHSIKLLSK